MNPVGEVGFVAVVEDAPGVELGDAAHRKAQLVGCHSNFRQDAALKVLVSRKPARGERRALDAFSCAAGAQEKQGE